MNDIIKEGYSKIAGEYHSNRVNKKDVSKAFFDSLLHLFPAKGKLLDLGCGGGQPVTSYFAEKGFDVTGVDITPEMIEIAKVQISHGKFIISDMTDCNFGEAEFNLIISMFAVIHVPQDRQQKLFTNIYKWLKDDGTVFLTLGDEDRKEVIKDDWHGVKMCWSYFSPEKYKEIITETGFRIVWDDLMELPNGEKFYYTALKKNL